MTKIQILSIGRDPVQLKQVSTFLNDNPNWESMATVDDEVAIEIFHQRKFDIILLLDSLSEDSEKKFRSVFSFQDPDVIFLHHAGNSTALLAAEIQEAISNRTYSRNNIMDNVFRPDDDIYED